jgi:hypothetical protein
VTNVIGAKNKKNQFALVRFFAPGKRRRRRKHTESGRVARCKALSFDSFTKLFFGMF